MATLTPPAAAQSDNYTPKEKEVRDLFRTPKRILWMKHYKGRVNDINEVGLILAYDGKHCKGYITFLRSRQRFKLLGSIEGGRVQLRETDSEESVTGHIEGDLSDDLATITAQWFNRDRDRAAEVVLENTRKEVVFPGYCGDNKWVREYEGWVVDEPAELLLQKSDMGRLSGVACFRERRKTYDIQGGMLTKTGFRVELLDDSEKPVGVLTGEIDPIRLDIVAQWQAEGDTESHDLSFKKNSVAMVGCIEYQDYMTTYDATYPKSRHKTFNRHMEQVVDDWKNSCQAHVAALWADNDNPGPDDRSVAAATGWFAMSYLSDSLVSGHMTFDKSWEEGYEDYAFNYNLLTGEPLALGDLFRKNVGYDTLLTQKALAIIKTRNLYSNPGFRAFINNAEFKYFTIREDGIRFSTGYNPIYGRQSATVPFEDLQDYLDPRGPVAHLYKMSRTALRKKRKRDN